MRAVSLADLPDSLPRTDILVSTLPIGMEGVGGGNIPDLSSLKPDALCMDCIYAPALTPFMKEAQQTGHKAANGIGMLVYQAVYALGFFLNRDLDAQTVTHLGEILLKASGVDPFGAHL